MKKLDLIFLSTAKHATHHMQFNFVDTDLDTEKVKQAMQQLADLKLFVDKDKHPLYEVPMVRGMSRPLITFCSITNPRNNPG